ncbi:hypothetical protein R4Z09_20440 [Niallia oryzisoli]|uniref:Uncharacterized protein n=1 Tax=Niallia oryzisoli TaxID=1737571 RepID=A0ABZ2CCS5_9BACI
MFKEEYERLLKKSVQAAPDWLKKDVESIVSKEPHAGMSYVISELHHTYTFSIRHILSASHLSSEWSQVSRERLNFIDNNIDIIVGLFHEIKNGSRG